MKNCGNIFSFTFMIFILKFVESQEPEETVNQCVAHSVPEESLNILMESSFKILSVDPEEFKKELAKAQEMTLKLSENLSVFTEDQKEIPKLLPEVLNIQKRFSVMLNSVFNTVLNNVNILETIDEKSAKSFGVILETLNKMNKPEDGTNEFLVPLLESILKNMNNSGKCESETPQLLSENDFNTTDAILGVQNETNKLLKDLIMETKKMQTLKDQMEIILKENQELKNKITSKQGINRPSDCHDLRIAGAKKSGVYEIFPDSCECGQPVRVWCDMAAEGGGWTVIIARGEKFNKQDNFTRSWLEYENGFGHPESEYWIGNANLHLLTSTRKYSLRLEVNDKSDRSKWGHWSNFEVASAEQKYKLSISGFSLMSSLDDVFKSHDGQLFSTHDSDNDSSYAKNCARNLKGGWWYGRCYDIHPTGTFRASDIRVGVTVASFSYVKRVLVPLTKLSIKIKPKSCVFSTTLLRSSKSYCDLYGDENN